MGTTHDDRGGCSDPSVNVPGKVKVVWFVCMYVRSYVCMHACISVCMHVYVYG